MTLIMERLIGNHGLQHAVKTRLNLALLKDKGTATYQHVENPPRRRHTDEPSLLDLVLTNEPTQISELLHAAPLGKSDHVLTFNFHCYVYYGKPKERFLYHKGNYNAMRHST